MPMCFRRAIEFVKNLSLGADSFLALSRHHRRDKAILTMRFS